MRHDGLRARLRLVAGKIGRSIRGGVGALARAARSFGAQLELSIVGPDVRVDDVGGRIPIAASIRSFTRGRAADLDPAYFETWVHLAEAYQSSGKPEDAVVSAERAVDLSRRAPHAMHMLASINHRAGRRAEADALLQQLERSEQRNAYEIAMLRMDMGHIDQAIRWLVTACEERTPQMAFFQFVHSRKYFEALRRDAGFVDILRCLDAEVEQ